MLRAAVLSAGLLIGTVQTVTADALDRLVEALRMEEVALILSEEGVAQAEELDQSMLGGAGGAYFQDRVGDIYKPDDMVNVMRQAMSDTMSQEDMQRAAEFFSTDLGQTIISLENSARRAISDPTIDEMARMAAQEMDRADPRRGLIQEYVSVNELVDRNVDGALSSDYSFFRGLADGQGIRRDDETILSDLWEQRDATRAETEEWLYGFLVMAYQPLSDADLKENIAFSTSPTGQSLNDALFIGFDRLYDQISYELGQAVAAAMAASEL